jgi:hypothetical protein
MAIQYQIVQFTAGHEIVQGYLKTETVTTIVESVQSTVDTLLNMDGTPLVDADGVMEYRIVDANPPKPSWA